MAQEVLSCGLDLTLRKSTFHTNPFTYTGTCTIYSDLPSLPFLSRDRPWVTCNTHVLKLVSIQLVAPRRERLLATSTPIIPHTISHPRRRLLFANPILHHPNSLG